jgi:hypothetical protein
MIAIQIRGELLSLSDDTSISIQLDNPLFIEDADILPGTYTLPFTCDLDDHSRRLLNYPDRKDIRSYTAKIEGCSLLVDGKPLLKGTLLVLSSSGNQARLSLIINDYTQYENLYIHELPNLGVIGWIGTTQLQALMLATAQNPENHNVVFTPVYNDEYIEDNGAKANDEQGQFENYWGHRVQNEWNIETNAFYGGITTTPFVKLWWIIDRMIFHFGFTFLDLFFGTEPALKKLYLYNNQSVASVTSTGTFTVNPGVDVNFNLNKYLPSVKCMDLLKMIRATFFVGIIYTPFRKQLKIVKYADVYESVPRHDWTPYMSYEYENSIIDIKPKAIGYDDDSVSDGLFADYNYSKRDIDGTYMIENNQTINAAKRILSMKFQRINYTDGAIDPVLSKLVPLYNTSRAFFDYVLQAYSYKYVSIPMIKQLGNLKYRWEGNTITQEGNVCPVRLIAYRGLYTGYGNRSVNTTPTYPYATAGQHGPELASGAHIPLSDEFSLLYNGSNGIYERRAKQYIESLSKNILKAKLNLRLQDILQYNYDDKVRIEGNNYLVKSMNISISKSGLSPTEVVLVRTS